MITCPRPAGGRQLSKSSQAGLCSASNDGTGWRAPVGVSGKKCNRKVGLTVQSQAESKPISGTAGRASGSQSVRLQKANRLEQEFMDSRLYPLPHLPETYPKPTAFSPADRLNPRRICPLTFPRIFTQPSLHKLRGLVAAPIELPRPVGRVGSRIC